MEFETIHGERIPKIGLGTWNLRGEECVRAVGTAFELGYRHIDTAEMYANEEQVGQALRASGLERSEIFLTSKVLSSNLRHAAVLEACDRSLSKLNLDFIDLYLIHSPNSHVPIEETMQAMNTLVEQGKVRLIGVSNFSIQQQKAAQASSDSKLLTNQVIYHSQYPQRELLDYCRENEVIVTSYSPLARGRLAKHKGLQAIGDRYGKNAAQIALRWVVQQLNVVTIPKSSKRARQRENIEIFDFALTDEEMTEITNNSRLS